MSACTTRGNSSRLPPEVASGLVTSSVSGSSLRGMARIVFGSTLPDGPGRTAVTLTFAEAGKTCSPTSSARGTVTARSVRNRTPPSVLTMLPLGTVLVAVKSLLMKRTVPCAVASSTRVPVTSKVWLTSTGTSVLVAGTVFATGSGSVAVGLATIRNATGPMAVSRGAMTAVAVGRNRYAPTPPTTQCQREHADADEQRGAECAPLPPS